MSATSALSISPVSEAALEFLDDQRDGRSTLRGASTPSSRGSACRPSRLRPPPTSVTCPSRPHASTTVLLLRRTRRSPARCSTPSATPTRASSVPPRGGVGDLRRPTASVTAQRTFGQDAPLTDERGNARRAISNSPALAESAAAAGPTPPCRHPGGPSLTWSRTWARPSTGSRRSSSSASPTPHSCPRRWPSSPPTLASGRRGCRSPRSGSRPRAPMTRSTCRCSTRRETNGPGRNSGWPASSTRRSSTASTQPTPRTDRLTSTPTSQPRSSAITLRCSPHPRGSGSGPSPPTPSGAPGRPCSGWPPTPRTTQARGSSTSGLTGRPGRAAPSRPT